MMINKVEKGYFCQFQDMSEYYPSYCSEGYVLLHQHPEIEVIYPFKEELITRIFDMIEGFINGGNAIKDMDVVHLEGVELSFLALAAKNGNGIPVVRLIYLVENNEQHPLVSMQVSAEGLFCEGLVC